MEPIPQQSYYTIQNNCITTSGTKADHSKITTIVKTIIDAQDDQRSKVVGNLTTQDLTNIKNLYTSRFTNWRLPTWAINVLRGLTEIKNAESTLQALIQTQELQKPQQRLSATTQVAPPSPPLQSKEAFALPAEFVELVNNSSNEAKECYKDYNKKYTEASTDQLPIMLKALYMTIINHEICQFNELKKKMREFQNLPPMYQRTSNKFQLQTITIDCNNIAANCMHQLPKNQSSFIRSLRKVQEKRQYLTLQTDLLIESQQKQLEIQTALLIQSQQQGTLFPEKQTVISPLDEAILNADLNTLQQKEQAIRQLLESKPLPTENDIKTIFSS
jgi:hypothetical protein